MIDFTLTISRTGLEPIHVKYSELASQAETIRQRLQTDIQSTHTTSLAMELDGSSIASATRFMKLLIKGGRRLSISMKLDRCRANAVLREGLTLQLPGFCTLTLSSEIDPIEKITVVVDNVARFMDKDNAGYVWLNNIIRLANALAWAHTYEHDLTNVRLKRESWDRITAKLEDPWAKAAVPTLDDLGEELCDEQ